MIFTSFIIFVSFLVISSGTETIQSDNTNGLKTTLAVTLSPTILPTNSPTFAPSPYPTTTRSPTFTVTRRPTGAPTYSATMISQTLCTPYTATNTASATANYATCTFLACRASTVKVSMCSGETTNAAVCSGDTYLRVYDASGNQVAYNDDYCSTCSSLSFKASQQCQFYTIRQGCFQGLSCGGTVAVGFFA